MKSKYFFLIISLIVLDQFVKYIVHSNMPLHSEISLVGDFIKLYHIENPGMAFGINFDFKYTKLILSLFRLFASFFIGFYLLKLLNNSPFLNITSNTARKIDSQIFSITSQIKRDGI